jgi:hypothetical protein
MTELQFLGAGSLLRKYVLLVCNHASMILPQATSLACISSKHFSVVSRVLTKDVTGRLDTKHVTGRFNTEHVPGRLKKKYVICSVNTLVDLMLCKCKIFSSPDLKAQVSYSDRLLSVVCLSGRLSVCLAVRPSVCLSVCKLLHFRLLLQNHWANFNQTRHKSSLGGGDSSFFKWRGLPLTKWR